MAKTIAVSDEVYELLRKAKLPSESFSSVIRRSLRKGKLSEIGGSGTITRIDWDKAKKYLLAAEGITARGLEKL